jgi:hypothetical protein
MMLVVDGDEGRETMAGSGWFSVRCLFATDAAAPGAYEERITLWRAPGFDEAIELAEAEARE